MELSAICDHVSQATRPASDGDRMYVGLEHIEPGFPTLTSHGDERDVTSGKTVFRVNDVLFAKLRPYLRKSVVAPSAGICSTDILVLRAKNRCLPAYLC